MRFQPMTVVFCSVDVCLIWITRGDEMFFGVDVGSIDLLSLPHDETN